MQLNNDDFFQNPYPFYSAMRQAQHPFWLPHHQDNSTSQGIWLFSRYADALSIFKQTSTISKNIRSIRPPGKSSPFDLHLLHRDGQDHLRLRRLVAHHFSSNYLTKLTPRITRIAENLILSFIQKGEGDLLYDFAEAMPLHVIAELIGVPTEDMAQIRAWSLDLGEGFDSLLISKAVQEKQKQALSAFMDYTKKLIKAKHQLVDGSLLEHIVSTHLSGKLDQDELTAMLGFLLFAGHETTINLIGNGLWLLLSNESNWQLLREDTALIPSAIEEILRFESPEQRTSFRITPQVLNINGFTVEKDQQIGIVIGAANRDSAAFDQAHRFDLRRTPNRHLAFGLGIHHCLGKTLARIEAQIAIGKAVELMPSLRLKGYTPLWRRNSFFRGLTTIPAQLS